MRTIITSIITTLSTIWVLKNPDKAKNLWNSFVNYTKRVINVIFSSKKEESNN